LPSSEMNWPYSKLRKLRLPRMSCPYISEAIEVMILMTLSKSK
jgi:hypothetical protein